MEKKKLLISLVSKQTIPNILLIKELKPDELLFITTEEMEKENVINHILDSCSNSGYSQDNFFAHPIKVEADNIQDIEEKLREFCENFDEEFKNYDIYLNLTGGNKQMALFAYEHISKYGAKCLYKSIDSNEYQIILPKASGAQDISVKLSIEEYLKAYGIQTMSSKSRKNREDFAQSTKLIAEYIAKNYESCKDFLKYFYKESKKNERFADFKDNRKKKNYEIDFEIDINIFENTNEIFFTNTGFEKINDAKYKIEIDYQLFDFLRGGWLEVYCYNEIKELLKDDDADISLSYTMSTVNQNWNEIDFLFVYENALYLGECKSLDQDHDKGNDILYKVAAIQNNFGLKVESFLVSTSPHLLYEDTGAIKNHVKSRAKEFKTTVIKNLSDFKDEVKNKIYL